MRSRCCDEIICEGCYVLLVIDEKRRFIFRVQRGMLQGTDKGVLKHDDIIGLEYGSLVKLSSGIKAVVHKPLLIDFLEKGFSRKTQVVYPKDQGLILMLTGIGPGAHVVEIGAGSGYTTAVLAHIVGDKGKIYAYEARSDMLSVIKRNLEKIGVANRVILYHQDARRGIRERNIDAIIVDIPDPWSVLEEACRALKPSAPIVFFVPSMNQVQRLLLALKSSCFTHERIYEVLVREYNNEPDALRPLTTMIAHTGLIVYARKLSSPSRS